MDGANLVVFALAVFLCGLFVGFLIRDRWIDRDR
jgi:hypothetical protein